MTEQRALSEEQHDIIQDEVIKGSTMVATNNAVKKRGHVPYGSVKEAYQAYKKEADAKKNIKREGAGMIRAFLEEVKEGGDVDEMAALLETALYRDLLRRYAETDEVMNDISLNQLLNVDLSLRKIRLNKIGKDNGSLQVKEAARIACETVETMKSLNPDDPDGLIAEAGEVTIEIIKERYGEELVDTIEEEKNEIERLRAFVEQNRNKATAGA